MGIPDQHFPPDLASNVVITTRFLQTSLVSRIPPRGFCPIAIFILCFRTVFKGTRQLLIFAFCFIELIFIFQDIIFPCFQFVQSCNLKTLCSLRVKFTVLKFQLFIFFQCTGRLQRSIRSIFFQNKRFLIVITFDIFRGIYDILNINSSMRTFLRRYFDLELNVRIPVVIILELRFISAALLNRNIRLLFYGNSSPNTRESYRLFVLVSLHFCRCGQPEIHIVASSACSIDFLPVKDKTCLAILRD